MPRRPPILAKLTLPRLHGVTRRERLFKAVKGRCENHPLVWVAGPPGAGKTSLIAGYLAEHKQRTLWYHLDSGDADLATFFHYLAQAAQAAAGRKQLRLPALTPEYMADVPGFTRRFMRELWTKVPMPVVLVLDDYHELPDDAGLHSLLPVALAESPVEVTLIVISRNEIPPSLDRERTHNRIGFIKWEDLRLTFEETVTIARSVSDMDQDTLKGLYTRANGWVAGTVLMLERFKVQEAWNAPIPSETMTDVFHYFVDQVFEMMNARERDVLMRTALLPWVTGPMAEEVSGDADAAQVIRGLYQRGLFVDRRADAQVRYQYHNLFREFLLDRCCVHFDAEALQSIKRTAAQVAERAGQQDTAVALYAETNSWDDLSRVIYESAEQLLSQGRNQTLQRYIGLLPEAERDKRPWLLYWSGISRLVFDPVTARKDLETAYQQFERTNQDIAGLFLSCSGIIESYHCGMDDMAPAIAWGDRLEGLLRQNGGFPSSSVEATVLANLQGLMLACPHHPLLIELESSIEQTLRSVEDPRKRLGVAAAFMNLPLWRGDFVRVRQILDNLDSHIQGASLSPLTLLTWRVMEANYAWNISDRAQAEEKLSKAFSIAEEFGIHGFMPMLLRMQTYNALAAGDDREGEKQADLMREIIQPHQPLALGQYGFCRAGIAVMREEFSSAREHAFQSVNLTTHLSSSFMAGNCRVGLAKILVELGEMNNAQEQLTLALRNARLIGSRTMEVHCLLTIAQLLLKESRAVEANQSLREGLQIAHDLDYVTLDYWWRPKVMAELLAQALEADIEVDFVQSVIRRRGLRAPSAALKHWPYPVKITTLGQFEVAIDDVPVTSSRKAQRKPLELLKYLSTAGPQGVHQDVIEEALWSDADGQAAGQAFRTTLHRLRKLLRHDDAVRLSDRHISLDPSLVSLDHMAFERLVQDVDGTDVVALDRMLALYRGHFLQGETASWILPVRERLRARSLQLTERLGDILEERGEAGEAVQKYLQALEVEPVAEVLCRRVMMTYVRLGRRSEALGVYQRFSQALRAKLGVPPTPETVSLYYTIADP